MDRRQEIFDTWSEVEFLYRWETIINQGWVLFGSIGFWHQKGGFGDHIGT